MSNNINRHVGILVYNKLNGQFDVLKRGKMRNVEIKATVKELNKLLERARALSGKNDEIIKQHDTFYKVHNGRLKLRRFEVSLSLS